MGVEIVVPVALFGMVVAIIWVIYSSAVKRRAVELETVRSIVDKTGEASPDLIKAIGRPRGLKYADLRKGLVLLAVAVAIALFGMFVPDDEGDAAQVLMGLAMFPGLVGLVYVLFHFMGGNKYDE